MDLLIKPNPTSKIHIEVCMISARGLRRRRSTFLKPQWFAVGWVDPDEKYCTRIDTSGISNPTWKTKFSLAVGDATISGELAASLTVEVYKREPIFLREKLHGVAVVPLKEFMVRFLSQTESNPMVESFQLRKKNSEESRGFVDISIHIYRKSEQNYHRTTDGDFPYANDRDGITIAIGDGPTLPFPAHPQPLSCRPTTPPPPPPPSNAGYLPSLFPGAAAPPPETYVSLPPQGAVRHGGGAPSGFGMGLGAGALAAGAVIFGDDFMSGSPFPAGLHGSSLTVSADGDALF
ncbi:protein SRC2-like [Zingiber officinale]|uniref:C2 domain-containing protein n=1 Tax=Zingiber officinale TaxID=94328 RepID=A0A8J5KX00_ZINOF|nr:protein SRC2-like [Zingiber officinale]KAG6499404.1 hypothetical protein ZIOFF_039190 [Zingiber officinale]